MYKLKSELCFWVIISYENVCITIEIYIYYKIYTRNVDPYLFVAIFSLILKQYSLNIYNTRMYFVFFVFVCVYI